MTVYSYSRIGSFETCPRKYWYAYIEKPEIEKVETVEAFLGSRAHETLEELYKKLQGGRVMTMEELTDFFLSEWDKNWHENIRIVNDAYGPEDYRQVGIQSLESYYRRYYPFTDSRTLKLEAQVYLDLDPEGRYRMRGFIDRLTQRPDGVYEIHDYKTSNSLPTQDDADGDRQLALYQIGLAGMWDDIDQVDLVWHYLRFDKEIRSRRTPEQVAGLKEQYIALIDDIEARGREEKNFPTNKSRLCDWCEYRQLCPAVRHPVMVETLPPEKFKADDGVKLVGEWAEIERQKKDLAARINELEIAEDEIRQRLFAFADQEGLETVAGATHFAEIKEKKSVDYPKSGDENRPAFEGILHKTGLWENMVSLHPAALKSLWKHKADLPEEKRALLEPFFSETTERTVKLQGNNPDRE